MAHNYTITCPNPNCGAELRIIEQPMGVPGGKEKEQAHCTECRTLVAEHMTDGFLTVRKVNNPTKDN